MTYTVSSGTLNPTQLIKASAGPGALPNAGPLQTYNHLTG